MRSAAGLGVVGLLLGRRCRECAPGSVMMRVGAGRERVWVDCEAMSNVGVRCRCWYECLGVAVRRLSLHLGCSARQCGGHGAAAGPWRRPGDQGQRQPIGRATGMSPRWRRLRSRWGHLQCGAWSACCSGGGAGSAHREAACAGAGAGREVVAVDCEAEADVGAGWRGWYSCWALQDGGNRALVMAIFSGNAEAIEMLLDRGADLEAKNNVRSSAAPPARRPVGVVRSHDAASCSAGLLGRRAGGRSPGSRVLGAGVQRVEVWQLARPCLTC